MHPTRSHNMSNNKESGSLPDNKEERSLPDNKAEHDAQAPRPYVFDSGSGDNTGEHTKHRGSSSRWWRRVLRRSQAASQQPLRQQASISAAKKTPEFLPRCNEPNGMTWYQDSAPTKLPLPTVPHTNVFPYVLDVTCLPPPPTSTTQGVVARWQQARLIFQSDELPEILRGPPIPWRANLSDHCYTDDVKIVFCLPATTPYGMPVSSGGLTYYRQIELALMGNPTGSCYWTLALVLTSRDGNWLASLPRAEVAALVGLDSVVSVVGRLHPKRDSLNSSLFYAKEFGQLWLKPSDSESHIHKHPPCSPSPRGTTSYEEMSQLLDGNLRRVFLDKTWEAWG
ncbi:hypothetical protein QBC34DRAFT_416170 [Podospora aff. communis PSN243]|uniref:Uncharacterized protein n=1 Tax=Podospora aff. communis PSN243 TaxID=3040156 RepID=A0AAV9G730_9PEZI|nr:hypothetical protein QBC34DRAFT_416170 [Podospora aff. communis PSN243]